MRDTRTQFMPFRFDQEKTLQAIGILLQCNKETKSDSYMRILKLLYMADRKSIKETGRPVTGDRFMAMERGPVLSQTYDIIKGTDSCSVKWSEFVVRDSYNIRLIQTPGIGKLCKYEIELLEGLWEEFREFDEWDLVRKTHEFQEWKNNECGKSSKPIPLKDVLEAVGQADKLGQILESASESNALTAFFGV
jgi:uncharacterized phage-associated protein